MLPDLQLMTAWFVAVFSLVWLIYVLVSWPTGSDKSASNAHRVQGTAGTVPAEQPAGAFHDQYKYSESWVRQSRSLPKDLFDIPPTDKNVAPGDSRPPNTSRPAPSLSLRMVRAGFYKKPNTTGFTLVRVALCLGLFVITFLASHLLFEFPPALGALVGTMAAVAGFLVPSFWLDSRLRNRQTKMRRALPDALDLITVCLQGGLSLTGALARVARELGTAHPMLATDLAIVEREVQMGLSTGDAMRQFANRFDLEELRSLASVIGQAEKFGGSISHAMATYADSLRTKRRIRAEEMAQKAAVKLLFPTLLCIFPGIFVVILGPTAIRMYEVIVKNSPW